uniref:Uncharacterized protein n=1 Tax=uncultured Armatimonadetes bacterium TaxID=157466 RepID=A0A6J4K6Q6_9BACT|nr:hypothetical protein AVDCRST_MAG63-5093 [uncultured Armatimonadetes bacterium]
MPYRRRKGKDKPRRACLWFVLIRRTVSGSVTVVIGEGDKG